MDQWDNDKIFIKFTYQNSKTKIYLQIYKMNIIQFNIKKGFITYPEWCVKSGNFPFDPHKNSQPPPPPPNFSCQIFSDSYHRHVILFFLMKCIYCTIFKDWKGNTI